MVKYVIATGGVGNLPNRYFARNENGDVTFVDQRWKAEQFLNVLDAEIQRQKLNVPDDFRLEEYTIINPQDVFADEEARFNIN